DLDVEFDRAKTLARPAGVALGEPVTGYEIHHGRVTRRGELPYLIAPDEGVLAGQIAATHWHGLLDNDGFRPELLRWGADPAGREGLEPGADTDVAALRGAPLDR